MDYAGDTIFWLGLLILSLVFPVLSGFGWISIAASIILMILSYALGLLYQIVRFVKFRSGISSHNSPNIAHHKIQFTEGDVIIRKNEAKSSPLELEGKNTSIVDPIVEEGNGYLKRYGLCMGLSIGLLLFIAIFLPLLFENSCLCNHNEYGL